MPGSGTTMKEYLAQAGIREAGAMDDVAQAARDAASVLEVRAVRALVYLLGLVAWGPDRTEPNGYI